MTPAEIEDIIDGWLFGFQRSLIHHRANLQVDFLLAGIYTTPNHEINTK